MQVTIKLTNKNDFETDFKRAALKKISVLIPDSAFDEMIELLKREAIDLFYAHDYINGLLGNFPGDKEKDLQAQFGLELEVAQQAVTEMMVAFRERIRITVENRNKKGQFADSLTWRLRIYWEDIDEHFRNIPNASYTYKHKTVTFGGGKKLTEEAWTIPWMAWFLDGGHTEAEIDFEYDEKHGESRSERAIMLRTHTGGWDFRSPQPSFVQQIVSDPQFVEIYTSQFQQTLSTEIERIAR